MTICEKLTRLLEDRNKTAVAKRAGLRPTYFYQVISEGKCPSAYRALRIARALNVGVEWLLDDAQSWPPVWVNSAAPELGHRSTVAGAA
jgi:hypothetical protein